MKLKRFALRGLILFAVAVALCMFFARTVQTITTAKIRLTTAGSGRFEDMMTFRAEVHFPATEEIVVAEAAKAQVTVDKVIARPGDWVKEGDRIFTCKVSGYDEELKKLRDDYSAKGTELMELDMTNRKSSRDSKANQCYDAMQQAQTDLADAMMTAQVLAARAGIKLGTTLADWPKTLALLDEAPAKELTDAVNKAIAAQSCYDAAFEEYRAVMEDKKQRVSSDTFDYIKKRNALIKAMNELSAQMVELTVQCESLTEITAPHSGYVTAVAVSAGEAYDGRKAAYTITAEGTAPVLRVPLEGVKRNIADGAKAEITSENSGTEKTTVLKTAVENDGKKYLYIDLPDSMRGEGSAALRRALTGGGVDVSVIYRATQATTLLNPSVVRADGDNSFVYLVERTGGSLLSSAGMKVVRMNVTVLERSDKTVSIAEDLSRQQLADREDRTLSDGQTVMEYVN